jgi:RNA ligase (TIGR02306 family)
VSSLIIEVCEVREVEKHPNADRMCVCTVKGWKTCAGRDPATGTNQFAPGDRCIYVPPDAVLPPELSDRWGVTRYLSPLARNQDGTRPPGGRVRVARLRGFPSNGFLMPVEDPTWEVGKDLAGLLGITKWEPPLENTDGDSERPHPAFHSYTAIENYRNFPDLFRPGERVILTEKLHGKNARLGRIRVAGADGVLTPVFMAGSHGLRRKEFTTLTKKRFNPAKGEEEPYEVRKRSQFWEALDTPGVKELLTSLDPHDAVLFGEIFGSGVQDLWYGHTQGAWGFRPFDVSVDGRYLSFDAKKRLFEQFGVPMVPILYDGPFRPEVVEEFVSGKTTAGGDHLREGVVITAAEERAVVTEKTVFDRAILKAVSFEYLERHGGTEFK